MRRPTKILLTAQIIAVGAAGLLHPIYAVYVGRIGGDILAASTSSAIFSIVGGALTILLGRFTDRVKEPEYFIVAGFFLAAAGYAGYIFVQNPMQLFIVQAVLGLAIALMTPALDGLYAAHLDGRKFASGFGTLEGVWMIAAAVAAFLGGIIATYLGFTVLFLTMSAMSFGTAIYILILPRRVL